MKSKLLNPPKKKLHIALKIALIVVIVAIEIAICFMIGLAIVMSLVNGQKPKIFEEGFFQYVVITADTLVPVEQDELIIAIAGLTKSGLKQEVLESPREIDGKPVRLVGFPYGSLMSYRLYGVESEKLRKVYIHDNIEEIVHLNADEADVMICSNTYLINTGRNTIKNCYIYKSLFDKDEPVGYQPANITFMNNYSDEVNGGYYRLDNIVSGETIPTPPKPERSGYEFTGWYTEPECTNAWNFDMSLSIEENEEFRLYANWKAN